MLVTDQGTWRWFDHPTEPNTRFRLRPLTDVEYQQCLDAESDRVIAKARALGGDLYKSITDAAPANRNDDGMVNLYPETCCVIAIQEWTYNEPCDEANKRLLDKDTQQWIKDCVLEMNAPRPLSSNGNSSGKSSKTVDSPAS